MALVKYDGFYWQATLTDLSVDWPTVSLYDTSTCYQQAGRRANSKAFKISSFYATTPASGYILTNYNAQAGILGVAIYRGVTTNKPRINIIAANGSEHLSLRVAAGAAGTLSVSRNGTTLWTSTGAPFGATLGAWTYLEFKFNIHASTGSFSVRVSGSDDALHTVTDVNTEGQTGSAVAQVSLMSYEDTSYTSNSIYVSDFYLCDLTGPAPANDFLGDCRIDTLVPTSAGSYSAFTPSTGSTHYTLVDEIVANNADYVSSDVLNAKETFGFEDLAFTPSAIFGMQVHYTAWKTASGARSTAALVKTEGVEYLQSTDVLSASALRFKKPLFMNPNTGVPWTIAEIQALEAGVKVVT